MDNEVNNVEEDITAGEGNTSVTPGVSSGKSPWGFGTLLLVSIVGGFGASGIITCFKMA